MTTTIFSRSRRSAHCNSRHISDATTKSSTAKIFIIGSPNVGKSVLFNNLTGTYVTVSNYPGTTVEVSRGKRRIEDREYSIIDTPGLYSLTTISEDERVARQILLKENPDLLLNVVDSKNLQKMLGLTLQLLEAGLPVILVLNMYDEAERSGLRIDTESLEKRLGVPVVPTVAVTGYGMGQLRREISLLAERGRSGENRVKVSYGEEVESFVNRLELLLSKDYHLSRRTMALLLLQEDQEIHELIKENEAGSYSRIWEVVQEAKKKHAYPLSYVTALRRQQAAIKIAESIISTSSRVEHSFSERVSQLMINPVTGFPLLLAVLYLGVYQFVGVFGAQVAVNYLERNVFGIINPWARSLVADVVPYKIIQELIVGEYGIITLGVRYAVSIILPIVASFFLVFAVIEDSGYLPRMALLVDRTFKKIGLSGRAVIPMTLGFGCDTMATIVTRTLETNRERLIATLLLALAIPCSAQLGIILAVLAGNPVATLIWASTIGLIFLLIGFLTSQLMPGETPSFYIELPPIRMPKLSNVLLKTYTRMEWYFMEVFPLFILASVLIWLGQITGAFDLALTLLASPVEWIGLPSEAAVMFLFGFFRRDYGAAGLFDLHSKGLLSGSSLTVAAVTLTLFIPCIAQLSVSIKERGVKAATAMALFIFPFAFFVGFLLNNLLKATGVTF